MRRGFSILSAIILLILVATLLSFMISTSNQSVKNTSNLYIKEQMELLAQSGVEFALLKISGASIRPNEVNLTYQDDYNISVKIDYISDIKTIESNGTAIFDVYVDYNKDDTLRFHRRTIQKP